MKADQTKDVKLSAARLSAFLDEIVSELEHLRMKRDSIDNKLLLVWTGEERFGVEAPFGSEFKDSYKKIQSLINSMRIVIAKRNEKNTGTDTNESCVDCGKEGVFGKEQNNLCNFCFEAKEAQNRGNRSKVSHGDFEEQWFDDARKIFEG